MPDISTKRFFLSKSRIQSGRQCHKRLWLELHRPELRIWSAAAQDRLDEGTRFGELARELLGGGRLIEADHLHVDEALAETAAAMAEASDEGLMLFEPAFSHQGVRVRVDAYVVGGNVQAGDTLIEAKSTASVKREYLWDCAIQTWVARGAGRPVKKIQLGLVNREFAYRQLGDYTGLLRLVDITAAVEALQPRIGPLVDELSGVTNHPQPEVSTGAHCSQPYGCPFLGHCQSEEPPPAEYPVELLPRATELAITLRSAGYQDIRDVPEQQLKHPLHRRIAEATRTGQPYVAPELRSAFSELVWPRYFLDFETVSFIIPCWPGTQPFEPLSIQFSCHRLEADGSLQQQDFLHDGVGTPYMAFASALLAAVGTHGPILVWNAGFESSRLKALAARLPEEAQALSQIAARLIDLLPPFRAHYYHRDMRGSWSLKAVLPTLFPSLAHAAMTISDGLAAQTAYKKLLDTRLSREDRATLKAALLDYCRLDTLALVRLLQWADGD